MDVHGLFLPDIKEFSLLLETNKGLSLSTPGDLFPDFTMLKDPVIQQNWEELLSLWLKESQSKRKTIDNGVTYSLDFNRYIFSKMNKEKIDLIRRDSRYCHLPYLFKRFYGLEPLSFINVNNME